MNPRDQLTLQQIFAEPPQVTEWEAIEDLLVGIGCRAVRDSDDRVGFERYGIVGSFPRPEVYQRPRDYVVRAVRDYLVTIGVTP